MQRKKTQSQKKGIIMKSKLLFLSTLLLSTHVLLCQEKIKLYALYTPSHRMLKDNYFLPSIQDNFEIICEETEQKCTSALFMDTGWTETTITKVDLIIRAIHENWGNVFIFSDVDIQFFCPIESTIMSLMKDNDLMIQKNSPNGVLCSGFFVCKANEKTLALWTDVKKIMKKDASKSDQISLNQCIKRNSAKNPYAIKWDYLPNTFFGGGTLTGHEWHPGKKLPIPAKIMMHHANWTKGIRNKIAQLNYVKKVVTKRNKN